ncbi:unnamed protein product [Parascedosporium putredinis]|uniref:NB-ARC domain-containing protein n=1 Tax=Parascedosporium putredinis TaxID=1442378 RepID=A0A9P1H0J2_9PEZI|nr:unnamed protein product [Parascedosporium putredinis]CAI7993980.1 unnamed protein product [Parascedosporium putredinis]
MSASIDDRWRAAVALQKKRLNKPKYRHILKEIEHHGSLQTWMLSAKAEYGRRYLPRVAMKLGPVLSEFGHFIRAITTMVQGGGAIAGLVWGSIQVLLARHEANIARQCEQFHLERGVAVDVELVRSVRVLLNPGAGVGGPAPHRRTGRGRTGTAAAAALQRALHEYMTGAPHDTSVKQRSCVVHARAGMGKTQLAIEYTYRYRQHFDYIAWVCADSEPELANGMAQFARLLGIPVARGAPTRAAVEAAKNVLETTTKQWLLIFDNVHRREDLNAYWPACASGSVLITSQAANIGRTTVSAIALAPLSPAEGAMLLVDQIELGDQHYSQEFPKANMIAATFHGHPLSIVHIAGFIQLSNISLGDFAHLLKEQKHVNQILNQDNAVYPYDKPLRVAHEFTLLKLDTPSSKLAQVLSMLSPEDCRRQQQQAAGGDLFMHRSLQSRLQTQLPNQEEGRLQQVFDVAVTLTRRLFPRQSPVQFPQNDIWEKCERYSPQVMSIMSMHQSAAQAPQCSIEYATLLSDLSNYLYERNIFEAALRASDAAETACEVFTSSHESIRADIHTLSGAVRDTYGIPHRQKTLYHYAMAVALRQDHLNKSAAADITQDDLWNYANAWGNMTVILLDYECYEDVILYADLAIMIKTKLLGSTSQAAIACYEQVRNKHIAYAALGRLAEAQEWQVDAEDITRDPTYTVIMIRYHFFHANILMTCGWLEQAHATLSMVLEMRTRLFGPSGRSTLDTYYLLAILELKRDNIHMAETDDWTEEAIARAKYWLAKVLFLKGEHVEARGLLEEAEWVRAVSWATYATYWPVDVPVPDQDAMYDHIVPTEAGRSIFTHRLPPSRMSNDLNETEPPSDSPAAARYL